MSSVSRSLIKIIFLECNISSIKSYSQIAPYPVQNKINAAEMDSTSTLVVAWVDSIFLESSKLAL